MRALFCFNKNSNKNQNARAHVLNLLNFASLKKWLNSREFSHSEFSYLNSAILDSAILNSAVYGMVKKGMQRLYKGASNQSLPSLIESKQLKYLAVYNPRFVSFGQYTKTRVKFSSPLPITQRLLYRIVSEARQLMAN